VAFRLSHRLETLPSVVDLLVTLEWNHYNAASALQLQVRDLRAAQ